MTFDEGIGEGPSLDPLWLIFPRLREVHFCVRGKKEAAVVRLLQVLGRGCPLLEELRLWLISEVDDAISDTVMYALGVCLPELPKLRKLDLGGLRDSVLEPRRAALPRCTTLRELNVCRVRAANLCELFAALVDLPLLKDVEIGIDEKNLTFGSMKWVLQEVRRRLRGPSLRAVSIQMHCRWTTGTEEGLLAEMCARHSQPDLTENAGLPGEAYLLELGLLL